MSTSHRLSFLWTFSPSCPTSNEINETIKLWNIRSTFALRNLNIWEVHYFFQANGNNKLKRLDFDGFFYSRVINRGSQIVEAHIGFIVYKLTGEKNVQNKQQKTTNKRKTTRWTMSPMINSGVNTQIPRGNLFFYKSHYRATTSLIDSNARGWKECFQHLHLHCILPRTTIAQGNIIRKSIRTYIYKEKHPKGNIRWNYTTFYENTHSISFISDSM